MTKFALRKINNTNEYIVYSAANINIFSQSTKKGCFFNINQKRLSE